MDSVPRSPQTLLATMLFEQLLEPLTKSAGISGGVATDRFAEILALQLEKRDG